MLKSVGIVFLFHWLHWLSISISLWRLVCKKGLLMCCSPPAFPFLSVKGVIGYLSFKRNVEINTLICSFFPLLSLLCCYQPIYSLDVISVLLSSKTTVCPIPWMLTLSVRINSHFSSSLLFLSSSNSVPNWAECLLSALFVVKGKQTRNLSPFSL